MISVIKRSGKIVPLDLEKWQTQIAKICQGIADVSQSMVEIKSHPHFYDGITTRDIDQLSIRSRQTKVKYAQKRCIRYLCSSAPI